MWEKIQTGRGMENHQKICSGSRMEGKKKECHVCKKWLIGSNLARHMRTVHCVTTIEGTSSEVKARVYKAKYVVCDAAKQYRRQIWQGTKDQRPA